MIPEKLFKYAMVQTLDNALSQLILKRELKPLFNSIFQHALINNKQTANQYALNPLQQHALNPHLQTGHL